MRECSSHTMCHTSRVTCHMSRVTCHLSPVTCNFFFSNLKKKLDKVVELVGGVSVINGAYPVKFNIDMGKNVKYAKSPSL